MEECTQSDGVISLSDDDCKEGSCDSVEIISETSTANSAIHNLENLDIHNNTTTKTETIDLCSNNEINCQKNKQYVESAVGSDTAAQTQSTTVPNRIITVSFKDQDTMNKYKSSFLGFFKSFIEFELLESDLKVEIIKDNSINLEEWVVVDGNDEALALQTASNKRKRKKNKKREHELFVLDTTPSLSLKNDCKYETKFNVVIDSSQGGEAVEEVKCRSAPVCFNCDGEHMLRDCPKSKNMARINAARQKYQTQRPGRYHLEDDQKYANLRPGKISENLRSALGLGKRELPHYIYKMRFLGYPPGWIKEAQVVHSDLQLYDFEGKNVSSTANLKKPFFDSDKIISYPGFNCPMEKGTYDDYKKKGCPPFSEQYSKEAMLEYINRLQANVQDNLETCDMDVDASSSEVVLVDDGVKKRLSPSLNELEYKKQELLIELEDSTSSSLLNISDNRKDTPKKHDDGVSTPLAIKNSSFGTPILKSASSYSSLPHPDNFSHNISSVINFENLPNSTGSYERMTGVLEKVRKTLKTLNEK